jgi:nucleoside-diphosphate-sugar epimerase
MNILVTGATGKIGSRLVPSLLDAGYKVRILVRNTNEVIVNGLAEKGAEVFVGDIMRPESLPKAIDGMDAIVHLAAFFRSQDTEKIRSVNIGGTKNLAEAAIKINDDIRFIFSSTSNVYNNIAAPGLETDDVNPAHAYPASKVVGEKHLLDLHGTKNLDVRILRFPFVYGAGDPHFSEAVPILEQWNWHPAQRLHLVHHADIAQAVKLAVHTPGIGGEIYNVGDDAPITLQEIIRIMHQTVKLVDPATPLTNPWSGLMDTTKIRALGFRPLVPSLFAACDLNIL